VHRLNATLLFILDLQLSEALLLYNDLILELIVLFGFGLDLCPARFKLSLDSLSLLGFFTLGEIDSLLYFALLILTLLLNNVISLRIHLLRLDVQLKVDYFLT